MTVKPSFVIISIGPQALLAGQSAEVLHPRTPPLLAQSFGGMQLLVTAVIADGHLTLTPLVPR